MLFCTPCYALSLCELRQRSRQGTPGVDSSQMTQLNLSLHLGKRQKQAALLRGRRAHYLYMTWVGVNSSRPRHLVSFFSFCQLNFFSCCTCLSYLAAGGQNLHF